MVRAGSLRLALDADADTQAMSVQPLGMELVLDAVTDLEYTPTNFAWRVNDDRPPHISVGSSAQGTLHELSSTSVGLVTAEFPQVPYTHISGYVQVLRVVSLSHSSPASNEKYVEPWQNDAH